jgi:hypothetical protein
MSVNVGGDYVPYKIHLSTPPPKAALGPLKKFDEKWEKLKPTAFVVVCR